MIEEPASILAQTLQSGGHRDTDSPATTMMTQRCDKCTCDVGGAEEELGLVVGEEGGVAAALLLVEAVDLAFKLLVGRDAARFARNLPARHDPITSTPLV